MIPIFISVHDEELILELEKNNIFRNISDYKYLFLGMKPVDKLSHLRNKVIVARELKDNIEYDKCLFDYTGWYALVKNNLINNSHVIIVHYDCLLYKNFEKEIEKAFRENKNYFISFQPHLLSCNYFLPDKFAGTVTKALKEVYNIDINEYIEKAIQNGDKYWGGGGSFACSKEWLESYIDWIEKIHPILIQDPMAAHNIERSMKFYNLIFCVKEKYLPKIMKHIFNSAHDQNYGNTYTLELQHREFERFIQGRMFDDCYLKEQIKNFCKKIKLTIKHFLLKLYL